MAAPKFDPATVDTTVIDRYAKIVTGNQNLVSAPDLVGALATGNATAEQAQAIDQYMGAQRAAQRVRVAQQSGSKINLTGWEKLHLDQLGVSYGAVEYTDDLRNADIIKSATEAGYVVDTDADGKFIGALTQEQARQRAEAEKNRKKADLGLTGGGGGFSIGDLNPITAIKDAGSNLLHGAQAAWNYVDYKMTNPTNPADQLVSKVNNRADGYTLEDQRDAAAAGYDPSSYWSMAAYAASGKAYNDTSDLINSYGQDRVDQAKLFLNNPDEFVAKAIAGNDAATGAQVLSETSTPEFQEMVKRVASRRAGIGNLVADNLGIDPVDNSKMYMGVSATAELAAALLLDPTNAIFAGYKGVKAAQIGLTGGAGDAAKISRVFDAANGDFKAVQVRRGAQSFLDETKIIANAAPDSLELAQAYARINARTPGLAPLIPDVLGVRRVAAKGEVVGDNLPQVFNVKPIESVEELGDYLASTAGMLRLTAGQSMVEGALIPGAIGQYGYRSIRAALASGTTRASFRITERNAARFLPTPTSAVTHTGDNVFAAGDDTATALARADGAERGDALYAARKKSIVQRASLAAARLVKFTPEDTRFVLGDPGSIEKARRYASLYLTKFDANNIAAQMARGDEGAQKAIINGLGMQTLHAAGAGNTTAGRKLIDQWSDFTAHRYGQIDDQLPDATGVLRPFGIHAADLTDTFSLPSFRDLRMGMAKTTVWSAVAGRVFENQTVDYLMGIVKAGWLLTGTNVVRNTGEPWVNLALRGEARETLAAKAAAREAGGLDAIGRLKITTALSKLPPLSAAGRAWRSLVRVGADPDELRYIAEYAERNGGEVLSSASKAHATSYLRQQDDVDILNQKGFGAVRHTISGRSVAEVDATREVSVGRAADQLARMAGDDPQFVRLVLRAIRTIDTPGEGKLVETRAGGVQYHGAREPIEGDLSAGFYNENNIYGGAETFYTTDAVDVAAGYGRRNPNAVVYRVDETHPVKFFDMENQLDDTELLKLFGVGADDTGRQADFIRDVIDAAKQGWGKPNLRQVMDEVRDLSSVAGVSKHGVQDVFDTVSHNLQQAGYGGMRHKGGLKTGAREHEVKIYLQPQDQIKLTPHTPERDVLPSSQGLAIAHIVNYMNNEMPRVWAQARRSNVYKDADGKWVPAVSADEKLLARQAHAQAIVDDWKLSLLTKDGVVSEKLADEIASTGKAPSTEWMVANLDDKTLPKNTLQDDFEAVLPDGKVSTFIGRLADISGDAFATLVQRPIDRLTTAPMFYNGYGKARKAGAAFEQRMIADGISPETADNIMSKWAEQLAFRRVYARTDNPTLKTQLDIVGRNFFAFSRASQDFMRRWATTFVEDPGRLRRAQLVLDAAVSGGVVWDDPATGNRNFTFPMTGALMDKLTEVGTALHLPFVPEIPTSTNVTGRVVFLQPGLSNPAQISLTPIANLPMRQVMKLFPDSQQDLMQEIDLALNGEMGYGKSTLNQLAPSAIKRLMDANDDDRDGMLASASKEALAALLASGRYDDYESWDDNKKQGFLDDVRTQTRNMLYMRAALGLFAPAPPSIDQAGFDEDVDGVFELLGVRNLDDEFKVILDKAQGDKGKAIAIWSELHPDKLVYTIAGSEGMTKGAYLPATEATNGWMTENLTWMQDNKNVAAYFIPADDTGGFSMLAWRAQLQLGLRQNKTLEEFAGDAATITSETAYYAEYNTYQQDLADAQLKGDKVYADQLKEMWSTWKGEFYNLHPLFREKQGEYGRSVVNAQHQIDSLRALVAGGSAPASVQAELPGLQTMLAYYDDHKAFAEANPGQTKKAVADRNYDSAQYARWMAEVAAQSPALTAVYNGVFRYLDKDLERIGG